MNQLIQLDTGAAGQRAALGDRAVVARRMEPLAVEAIVRGYIIADTKFEVGLNEEGRLYLIDEVLTPDSSRFWPARRPPRSEARG